MHRLSLLFVPLSLSLSLFAACDEEASPAPESELIGGRPATDAEFPATLLIKGVCTATRVGPRHLLTAAHCINNKPMFAAGATIEITADNGIGKFASPGSTREAGAGEAGAGGFKKYTVDKASMSPSWTELCPRLSSCGNVSVSGRNNVADAALIVLREDITDIPLAAIDLSPVAAGDPVVVTGYGCEDAVGGSWDYSHQRLRVAATKVQAFAAVLHKGSFVFEDDRQSGLFDMLDGISVITPGGASARPATPLLDAGAGRARRSDGGGGDRDGGAHDGDAPARPADPSQGGLCPGDSGGPLYRVDAQGLTVVGINANYTFSSGNSFPVGNRTFMYGGTPVTNWHARVDGKRGLAVGTWLKGLGVRTVCTRGECP